MPQVVHIENQAKRHKMKSFAEKYKGSVEFYQQTISRNK
jgi:hypothetical protein